MINQLKNIFKVNTGVPYDGKPIVRTSSWETPTPITTNGTSSVWFQVVGNGDFYFSGTFDGAKIHLVGLPYEKMFNDTYLFKVSNLLGAEGIVTKTNTYLSTTYTSRKLLQFVVTDAGASTSIKVYFETYGV